MDGEPRDVANVVWATGFRQVFDWIQLPVFGEDGYPREMRGVVADAPGLFFCGLSFQYSFSSMLVSPARAATRRTSSTGSWPGSGPRGSPRPPDPPYARSREVPAMGVVEVEQARTAFDRGDWDVAFEGWSAAGADALAAAELEDLATAAELLGRHDEAVRALQQAFTRYQQAGDLPAGRAGAPSGWR